MQKNHFSCIIILVYYLNKKSMSERLNENYDSPKEELHSLERKITKDFKEFQTLSQDTNVIKWLTKVFDKCWNKVIEDEAKWIENLDIWGEMKDILKKHPDLWEYVSWTLKLPLSNVKFSQLNTQQKINYLAFHDAFRYRRLKQLQWHKEPTNAENIINNCNANLKKYSTRIDSKFSGKNLSNLFVLEKTLKDDFWLTNIEAQQVKKYLMLIKKHPEYVNRLNIQESWLKAYGITFLIGLAMWAIWMYWVSHLWDRPETNVYGGRTEISEPQEILKLLTQESEFLNSWSIEKKMFTVDSDDSFLEQLWKEAANRLQSTRIDMKVEGKLALQYDLQKYCKMYIDHETGTVYLNVNQPDVVITDWHAEVMNKNREWVHEKNFDNAELELQEQLKQQALDDAKNKPDFYEKAKSNTRYQLLRLFQAVKPHWVEIKDVVVNYNIDRRYE